MGITLSFSYKVADLDDEFAELVLAEFSENFDSLPAEKVCDLGNALYGYRSIIFLLSLVDCFKMFMAHLLVI